MKSNIAEGLSALNPFSDDLIIQYNHRPNRMITPFFSHQGQRYAIIHEDSVIHGGNSYNELSEYKSFKIKAYSSSERFTGSSGARELSGWKTGQNLLLAQYVDCLYELQQPVKINSAND